MEENKNVSEKEAMEKTYVFVIKQIKIGTDKSVISQKLVEMGIPKNDADKLVETTIETAKKEEFTAKSVLPATIGGILASVISGVIWGFIVIATGYEVGYVAWGVGLLCGFAVVLFTKGKKGVPLQIIAVISSILGIIIGKYFTFFHYVKEDVIQKYGNETASGISMFSGIIIQSFFEGIGEMVGGYDIVWIILAVITAWRIPKGLGIKLQK